MPTFDTPRPISVTIDIGCGDILVVAGERADTAVEVRPRNPDRKGDVGAAEQTRVELSGERLSIRAPKSWRQYTPRGGGDSIDVEIAVPAGSDVEAGTGLGAVRLRGPLRECRCRTGLGDVDVERAGRLTVKTGAGDVGVDHVSDHLEVSTGAGALRIGAVEGTAAVRSSNGDISIGEAGGDLRINAANGRITVDRAGAAVAAKTAIGDVRIGEVSRGAVVAQTGFGKVDIGVRSGVAAWLDLDTGFGRVTSDLEAADRPGPDEGSVEVRARTACGDIAIQRVPARSRPVTA